ncbi:MAG: hypothetical protein KC656_28990 [Myxococcales bacterium]|nr:hypothetical protein [Myxococcales bacterium]
MSRLLALAVLSLVLPACAYLPEAEVELSLAEGGSVDGLWASGSQIPVRATVSGGFVYPTLRFEGEPVSVDRVFGTRATVDLEGTGTVDIQAVGPGGDVLATASIEVVEPVGHMLGAHFAWQTRPDVALPGMAFATSSCMQVSPVGLIADGEPVAGVYADLWASSDGGVDLWAWYDDEAPYAFDLCAWDAGTHTVTLEGDLNVAIPLRVVDPADIVAIELRPVEASASEGYELLYVLGWTVDGVPVVGLEASWGEGWTSNAHPSYDGERVRACVNGLCASWPR